jgi:hypothetical protein
MAGSLTRDLARSDQVLIAGINSHNPASSREFRAEGRLAAVDDRFSRRQVLIAAVYQVIG